MMDMDVREIPKGTQVTFEIRSHTVIGVVGKYLGEGVYIVTDEDDKEYEVEADDMTIED